MSRCTGVWASCGPMIQGMRCRENLLPSITLALLLAGFVAEPTPLIAGNATRSLVANQPDGLTVQVYGFPGLSPWTVRGAETEAERILRSAALRLTWIDCTSRVVSASCPSSRQSADLVARFLAKALPQATPTALGMAAGSSRDSAVAFIFYDRVAAMRTQTRSLPVMLGRVMAHEITHLLLPEEDHSQVGLMRAQWAADDLRITSWACLGVPLRSVQLMQREVLRRALARTGR